MKPDLEWRTNEKLAAGKGATAQEFIAEVGDYKLEITVAPWGEGQLKINGKKISQIENAKDRRQAFRGLADAAERYLKYQALQSDGSRKIPTFRAKLLEGKKGLIVGIANDQSIAWGCAKAFRGLGAEIAATYLNEKARKHVEPLAQELQAPILMPLDVRVEGQMEAVFERIGKEWGKAALESAVRYLAAFTPYRLDHWRREQPLESPNLIGCSTKPRLRLPRAALSASMRLASRRPF